MSPENNTDYILRLIQNQQDMLFQLGFPILVLIVIVLTYYFWKSKRDFSKMQNSFDQLKFDQERLMKSNKNIEIETEKSNKSVAKDILKVPEVNSKLIKACSSGKCVLYIGAGVLVPSGYPTWTKMISKIVMHIEKEEPNGQWRSPTVTPFVLRGTSAKVMPNSSLSPSKPSY